MNGHTTQASQSGDSSNCCDPRPGADDHLCAAMATPNCCMHLPDLFLKNVICVRFAGLSDERSSMEGVREELLRRLSLHCFGSMPGRCMTVGTPAMRSRGRTDIYSTLFYRAWWSAGQLVCKIMVGVARERGRYWCTPPSQ